MAEDAEMRAQMQFIDDLFARGEAVWEEDIPEGQKPPRGVTHVVKRGEDGQLSVKRVRFGAV